MGERGRGAELKQGRVEGSGIVGLAAPPAYVTDGIGP